MGTTLTNGVYLPNEGERNCYAGLKTNWEILDQKVADVTALQQAVAGALHREIVESLPTTDIDPNTIYMVLSGTSATENVYNEFMYVNNAWELIGTSATDLTNYYTKSEVDGKLLLKANASDLTSHTGDTTIHVTTADKSTWNTVTSKANDSDVVHKSGDETVGGKKTFSENITCFSNSDAKSIICKTPLSTYDSTNTVGDNTKIRFLDKNNNSISYIMQRKLTNGSTDISLNISNTDNNNQPIEAALTFVLDSANEPRLSPGIDNTISVGRPTFRYKSFYGMNYYYGSNNVEFSTKFVTTDTAQTISGSKTFSSNVNVYNSDSATDTANLILRNQKAEKGGSIADPQIIYFVDKLSRSLATIRTFVGINGQTLLQLRADNTDSNNNAVYSGFFINSYKNGSKSITPSSNSDTDFGTANAKWKSFNSVEPSSLSLPSGNASDVIDISSYITDLSGAVNSYTAPANGWISIAIDLCKELHLRISGFIGCSYTRSVSGRLIGYLPVVKNQQLEAIIYSDGSASVAYARFIPCQGNV